MNWTSGPPHLLHRCFASRTPAAGWGRNIHQSGRLLNILEAVAAAVVARTQLGEETRLNILEAAAVAVARTQLGETHILEAAVAVAGSQLGETRLNILEAAVAVAVVARCQVEETRAAEPLVGRSQHAVCCHLLGRSRAAELVPVAALDPGTP